LHRPEVIQEVLLLIAAADVQDQLAEVQPPRLVNHLVEQSDR
jgi:hypothetical protein